MAIPGDPCRAPLRSEHTWRGPGGALTYDRWGTGGRPLVFLHGVTFDRRMWWPVAAELADDCLVIAVDLPGHGETPRRSNYEPAALAEDIGHLVHDLGVRRAPVIVGHATAGFLAATFGACFVARAVVTVGQSLDVRPLLSLLHYLNRAGDGDSCMAELVRSMRLDRVPDAYRDLVEPVRDPRLVAAYLQWMVPSSPDDVMREIARLRRLTGTVHLEILGEEPWQGYSEWAQRLVPTLRREVYSVPGQFPHLVDVLRFAADLRKLL
jgi:pimeloyl-ACP methyl ester carboxylesterase